jgi:hypothetical protein
MKTADRAIRFPRVVLLAALLTIAAGCATTNVKDDPLKYTKKLVTEGHVSLYKNGAFQVPNTSIALIPPGPRTMELVGELAGVRAKQSFLTSIERAADSVYIVSEGTKLTYRAAKDVREGGIAGSDAIKKFSRENSTLLVYRSTELGGRIIGKSWDLSKSTFAAGGRAGGAVIRGSGSVGDRISEAGTSQGTGLASASLKTAKDISSGGAERSGAAFTYAGNAFVKGYAAVPSNMKKRAQEMGESLSDAKFGSIIKEENETRANLSQKAVDLMAGTLKNYPSDVAGSFKKAGDEFKGSYQTTGLSLAVLKSMRWVLQGIFWDATIEPLANMTAASVGYIGVNLVAFPSLVVVREGVATTKLAVEVTWDTAKMGYDIVAPTGTAALAGVYGLVDFTGSQTVAGTTAAVGTVAGYGAAGVSKTAGVIVKGGGFAAGKGVQYIGVPLASAGIAVGGGTVGTVVGGVGAASGGALLVTGETTSAATNVFGNVIAGATLVGGTAASTAGGAAYGVYELSKAVVVPAGYELGGGVVLSYGTMAHLGAHSILAVSDFSYMVLSLEGPRWVLYAIRGKTGEGEDLPVGAVVDLKKMQESGEEIYNVPVSDEEMKKVVESVHDNLPEIQAGANELPAN